MAHAEAALLRPPAADLCQNGQLSPTQMANWRNHELGTWSVLQTKSWSGLLWRKTNTLLQNRNSREGWLWPWCLPLQHSYGNWVPSHMWMVSGGGVTGRWVRFWAPIRLGPMTAFVAVWEKPHWHTLALSPHMMPQQVTKSTKTLAGCLRHALWPASPQNWAK